MYWEIEKHIDKTIPENRPDILCQTKADKPI